MNQLKLISTTNNQTRSIIDTIPNLNDWHYVVRAVDSCGRPSEVGRYGKPVVLGGHVEGLNEFSRLKYSQYYEWENSDITYNILEIENSITGLVSTSKTNFSYDDYLFMKPGLLETCYVIEATNG